MYRTPGNRIEQMNRRQLIELSWQGASHEVVFETLIEYEDCNDEIETEVLRAELVEMHREAE